MHTLDCRIAPCVLQDFSPKRLRIVELVVSAVALVGCTQAVGDVASVEAEGAALLATSPELSDAEGLQRLTRFESIAVLPESGDETQYLQRSSRDRGSSDLFFSPSRSGNRDYNNFVCRSSNASVGSSILTPYRYDRTSCQESYVRGVVLARFEGSGRLARSWLTAQSARSGALDNEVLRIYVDDNQTPVVDESLAAVMDGSAGEIFAPPFGAGSTSRLAWYYPVTFASKLIVVLDNLGSNDRYYHQTDVVYDEVGPVPGSALTEERAAAKAALNVASATTPRGWEIVANPGYGAVSPGSRSSIGLNGPVTVRELRLHTPVDSDHSALSNIRVRISYESSTATPAIDTTLADLFGGPVRLEQPSHAIAWGTEELISSGLLRATSFRLPLAATDLLRIETENVGTAPVTFGLRYFGEFHDGVGDDFPFAEGSGYLHVVSRTSQPNIFTPAPATHTAVDVQGSGRLAGVCARVTGHGELLYGLNYDLMNFLEGDVRADVDGVRAIDGTGTAEFADDAFYFEDAPLGTAFSQAGAIQRSLTRASASLCRWQTFGTELDFQSSLNVGFELGGSSNPSTVERIDTIAYVYRPNPAP